MKLTIKLTIQVAGKDVISATTCLNEFTSLSPDEQAPHLYLMFLKMVEGVQKEIEDDPN